MNRLHSANRLTAYRAECLAQLSFDVLDACEIRGEQAPGWTGQQTNPFTAS